MIGYDLILAFILALVAWGLVLTARALRALTAAVAEQTDILMSLARHLDKATVTTEESDTLS